ADVPLPASSVLVPGASFVLEDVLALPLKGRDTSLKAFSNSDVSMPALSLNLDAGLEAGRVAPQLDGVALATVPAAILSVRTIPEAQIAIKQADPVQQTEQTLDSTLIQSLPVSNRDWKSFLAGGPPDKSSGEDRPSPSGCGVADESRVDGVKVQSVF